MLESSVMFSIDCISVNILYEIHLQMTNFIVLKTKKEKIMQIVHHLN